MNLPPVNTGVRHYRAEMVGTVIPTVFSCATHWSFLGIVQGPQRGFAFFFGPACRLCSSSASFGWWICPYRCSWCGAGPHLYLLWGHPFAPCPFGFNPILAVADAGNGRAVAQLLARGCKPFASLGLTIAVPKPAGWHRYGSSWAQSGQTGRPGPAAFRFAKPGWEFCYHFLTESLNQGLTLQAAGQQEMHSVNAMGPMARGDFKWQKPPNHLLGSSAHTGAPQPLCKLSALLGFRGLGFFPPLFSPVWWGLCCWVCTPGCQRFQLLSWASLSQSHCGSWGTWAHDSRCLLSHWALLLFFLFILVLKEDLNGNCTLIPRSAPEGGEKDPHNST